MSREEGAEEAGTMREREGLGEVSCNKGPWRSRELTGVESALQTQVLCKCLANGAFQAFGAEIPGWRRPAAEAESFQASTCP